MATKICPQCNNQFTTKHKHTIHCSPRCNGISKRTHSFEKVCECCGNLYSSKHKNQKFCSPDCQHKSATKERTHSCSQCGKKVDKLKSRKSDINIFCNRECYEEFQRVKLETRQCSKCGKDITRPLHQFTSDKVFCSVSCNSKKDRVLVCKVCNKEFCSIQYRKANNENGFTILRPFRETCSQKCLQEFYRTDKDRKNKISFSISGENHPNYINGASKNGRVRKTELREIFSLRDKRKALDKFNNSCFICGANEDLTIDHHLPFALGGRLTESNTVVLCRSCNSRKNAKHPDKFYTKEQLKQLNNMGINSNNLFNFVF